MGRRAGVSPKTADVGVLVELVRSLHGKRGKKDPGWALKRGRADKLVEMSNFIDRKFPRPANLRDLALHRVVDDTGKARWSYLSMVDAVSVCLRINWGVRITPEQVAKAYERWCKGGKPGKQLVEHYLANPHHGLLLPRRSNKKGKVPR